MTAHSKSYSASASARWLSCPASVNACAQYTKRRSSAFADEGTCAHELAKIALTGDLGFKQLQRYIGKTLSDAPTVVVNAEMVRHVDDYAEYCRSFKGDAFVEERVSYQSYAPGGFGTADYFVIGENHSHVIDLKYGSGVIVEVEKNSQAMLYALGIIEEYDFLYDFADDHVFTLHIYQPRMNNICEWSITVGELKQFGAYVKEQVILAESDNAPFNPTEKGCRWCDHKANCKAIQKFTEDIIMTEFDNLDSIEDLPAVETIDIERVLSAKALIEGWLDAVERLAVKKLNDGDHVKGYKLVEGRSLRKWSSDAEELIVKELGDDAYDKKLISVAQLEKRLGKDAFKQYGDLVVKAVGKPTLARESDKRKAIDINSIACEFDVLDD